LINQKIWLVLFSLLALTALAGTAHAAGIIIGSGSTLDAGTATITVPGTIEIQGTLKGNQGVIQFTEDWWRNGGTFESGSSTVELTGLAGSVQNVKGSTSFKNFKVDGIGKSIIFQEGQTQEVTSKLTLKGQSSPISLLTLRSPSVSQQWHINPKSSTGTREVSYVDVRDSVNDDTVWISAEASIDSGNNVRWFFYGAPPFPSSEAADDGWIYNTQITRLGSTAADGIRLTWDYNGATSAEVWEYKGAGIPFTSETTGYIEISPKINSPINSYDVPGILVRDGQNAYYRVVPGDLTQSQIFGSSEGKAYNKRTVGKVDITIEAAEYNAISYPFNSSSIDIPTLMGGQLSEGDQVHWWEWNQSPQAYLLSTKVGSGWSAAHTFGFGDGLFIFIKPANYALYNSTTNPARLCLVGLVDNFAPTIIKSLGIEYNLVGYPYPIVRNGNQVGFAPTEGDQIHKWIATASPQTFTLTTYVSGNWNNIGITTFEVGSSKFYYRKPVNGATNWNFVF